MRESFLVQAEKSRAHGDGAHALHAGSGGDEVLQLGIDRAHFHEGHTSGVPDAVAFGASAFLVNGSGWYATVLEGAMAAEVVGNFRGDGGGCFTLRTEATHQPLGLA